eukprot:CAMPEP_0119335996 /NCGR_PEP_ID=MMETSP1333-20130426/90882_1 /TAXON_ID=418940 /ORGANISM="Scyphosphaera apsteinii, Strain RCC1455" /LENGTH=82 /DNA_ID=CAMNT_0007346697 /DNA_START=495 /DNA_END=740 /DNA_ORIENTATION=-
MYCLPHVPSADLGGIGNPSRALAAPAGSELVASTLSLGLGADCDEAAQPARGREGEDDDSCEARGTFLRDVASRPEAASPLA